MVKKAFSRGALIIANIDGYDFNMPTNSYVVIDYFTLWSSKGQALLFFHALKKMIKRKKYMKMYIENLKGQSMQMEKKK